MYLETGLTTYPLYIIKSLYLYRLFLTTMLSSDDLSLLAFNHLRFRYGPTESPVSKYLTILINFTKCKTFNKENDPFEKEKISKSPTMHYLCYYITN